MSQLEIGTLHNPTTTCTSAMFSASFVRLLVVQMAFGISFSAFLLLPKFLKVEMNASASQIGWVAGAALVAAALASPFIGLAAHRFNRKNLLSLALILEGAAALSFTFISEVGLAIYSLRIVQGIAFVLVFNCTTTMVADSVPKAILARSVGYLGVSMMVTNALAPLVVEPLVESHGWKVAFACSGAIALLALFLVPSLHDPKVQHRASAATVRSADSSLRSIYFGSLLMGAGLGSMFTFIQPFALEEGADRVGQFFLGYVGAAMSVRIGLGHLTDKVGATKVATLALIVYAAVTSASSQLTPGLLLPLGIGLGVAHGFLYPALTAAGLSMIPPQKRSVFMGWFICAFNSGFAVTVLALGPVADTFGYETLFLLVGASIVTGIPFLMQTHRQSIGL